MTQRGVTTVAGTLPVSRKEGRKGDRVEKRPRDAGPNHPWDTVTSGFIDGSIHEYRVVEKGE